MEREIKLPENITLADVREITDAVNDRHAEYVQFLKDHNLSDTVSAGQLVEWELYKLSEYRKELKKEIHEIAASKN